MVREYLALFTGPLTSTTVAAMAALCGLGKLARLDQGVGAVSAQELLPAEEEVV